MFAKLPQRLTAPFGLLGDEAKLAFPSQPGGIAKLATTRHIPETDSYWNQYFILFDSASDVFSLITPHHVRRALLDAPENVATLIRVVAARLFNLLSDHTFPSSSNAYVAAFASSFMKPGTGAERNATKEVLNCIRILQRVLPVIFEVDGESNAFELEVLWKKEEVEVDQGITSNAETSETPQFVIEDDESSEGEPEDSAPVESAKPKEKAKQKEQLPSLGEKLFSSIMDLLFCCGFTLPTTIQVAHHKINYVIWEKGVGSTADPGPNHAYDSNKTEVLRLLLVLLSRQIYVPPGLLFSKPSLYSLYLVQKIPRRDVLTLMCSLLNTAMNSSTSHDMSIGGMAGSVAGKLPYNHLVFKGEDPRSTLVATCLQVLCALLDFQSGNARDRTAGTGDAQSTLPSARSNTFRYFLMKLHRSQDFEFIVNGIAGILEQQMATMNNLLPGARKSIPYTNETIIFFWKMIELNKKFRTYVLQSDKSMDLVAYLLCYTLEMKDKPQQHGFCRALSYIIQTLSAEPGFGPKLTKPVKPQLPAKWNAAGTAADFMINAVYAIVATTSGTLNLLYPALLIALANSAPYFKDLTVTASTRLVQLFKSFSNPLFLLADEGHPRLLFFMLEVFNSVILHHLSDNANLVYGILSAHKTFEDLGTFTLSRGLREIKRVQQTKEEQARKAEGTHKGKAPGEPDENSDPGTEKARLLESEGATPLPITESIESLPETMRDSDGQEERKDQDGEILTRSFMSPNTDSPIHGNFSMAASEKARGKMKERRSLSQDTNSSLDRIAAAGVGRNGFVPTQEWVTSWQQGLPLDSVMILISELLPKVQELQATRHKANSTSIIVDFLSKVSLKHVLPETPIPSPRRFLWSDASVVWLTSLIWGETYVRAMTPLGIWNATNVRLFYVKHSPNQPRQITETVTNVVGGFLRRNSDSPQARTRS
ncbi:high-temperature-induced dauer-formation protein-domain-containing protein [Lyophyllum atratum]|nr:high-temperature-induced dauer-formation protein-domain-containing protein [Lyophyllum atratum]